MTGKTVLVTGGGRSIGSKISRQIARFGSKKLLFLGHGENSIYTIDMELRNTIAPETELVPIIADVQEYDRIMDVMTLRRPDVVYHATAHKLVPLMEANPTEAVKNNNYGTKNVANASHIADVEVLL